MEESYIYYIYLNLTIVEKDTFVELFYFFLGKEPKIYMLQELPPPHTIIPFVGRLSINSIDYYIEEFAHVTIDYLFVAMNTYFNNIINNITPKNYLDFFTHQVHDVIDYMISDLNVYFYIIVALFFVSILSNSFLFYKLVYRSNSLLA